MSKSTRWLFVMTLAIITATVGYFNHKQQQRFEILEHYIQTQQEIICLNANSLPIQFQEHKEACYGVEGGVLLRHQ
ncbi:hypothetical protein J4G57_05410 [Aeromonas caviae]|uniref:hypothetical protein n=1 Tax=Aeromonas caviae TaxID=648 RepID=UPI001BD67AE2|nr:hypothetical protein [Aeromonas caviae]MBS4707331.1 hypothetical protein [Aeromonas caviae]